MTPAWPLAALLLSPFSTPLLPAQSIPFSAEGAADGDNLGMSCANAGDTDKDGVDDFVVGAPRDRSGGIDCGCVSVLSGKTGAVLRYLRGEGSGGKFGYAVAGGGDVDGDGYADIVVGAPYDDHLQEPQRDPRAGAAHVFSGRDGALLYVFYGPSADDALGWSVGIAGDVDGDGCDDVMAGAPFWDRGRAADVGMVRIYSGKTGKLIRQLEGTQQGDRFGWSMAPVGDINRDKVPEILIGIEGSSAKKGQAGSAALYSGKTGKLIRTLRSGQERDYFGTAVANAGDLDGDNRDDLIVGGWNGHNDDGVASGIAVVFSGWTGKPLLRLSGTSAHDHFGAAVAGPGDVNGDGHPDIAVGAPQEPDRGSGYVRVFSGADGSVLFTLVGAHIGDGTGTSVAAVGDRNEDGVPDLLVGAPNYRDRGRWAVYASPARHADK